MLIGSRVLASSDYHEIEGVIVAGFDIEDCEKTRAIGREISLDDVVSIKCDDDGKVYQCNGWLWTFEAAEETRCN